MNRILMVAFLTAGMTIAGNMWENHGFNFSYFRQGAVDSVTVFPGPDCSVPVAFCVGQAGYRSTDDPSRGILGRRDTAILGCYSQGGTDLRLAVFARDRGGQFTLHTREPYTARQLNWVVLL